MEDKYPAVVLGMFETGLGIGRSLGRNKIQVFGLDYKKDVGFYSKYIKATICPDPVNDEQKFLDFLISFADKFKYKSVLFIASDNFLKVISKNRDKLKKYFFINLPDNIVIESISDKYKQYQLILKADIPFPMTYFPKNMEEVYSIKDKIKYPAFLKAKEVTSWRKIIGGGVKGFILKNPDELVEKYNYILGKGLEVIVQELIPGSDNNIFQYIAYVTQNGEFLLEFNYRKIHQNPIHFGFGSMVESVYFPDLMEIGKKFFKSINFRGVGTVEFKLDERDMKLKIIELNPRYVQQNALIDRCGMNIALIDYLESTQQKHQLLLDYEKGIKWVNCYHNFDSFLNYRRNGEISFKQWINSLKGKKIFSVFAWDDMLPSCYGLSKILIENLKKLIKKTS